MGAGERKRKKREERLRQKNASIGPSRRFSDCEPSETRRRRENLDYSISSR